MFAKRVNPLLFVAALLAVCAGSTGLAAGEKLDLKYVNADAIAALIIHPRELLTAPELELLPREVIIAACIENLGIDPGEIDEAIGLMAATGLPAGEPAIGAILRFTQSLDAKLLADKLGRQTREVTQGGQTYHESTAKGGFGYAIVDERTLLLGTNLALKAMLAPDKADTPLRKLLAERSTSKLAVLLVDVETIRPLLQLALKSLPPLPPEFQEFLQAPEMAKWVELSLELRGGFDLQLTLGANDADAARKLTLMGERLKTIARDMVLDAMRASLPRGDSPTDKAMAQYMNRLLNRLVEMVVIKTEADQVHVTLEGENMPQMATSGVLVALLLPAVQAARVAARRNATVNNLRQIGVGMHEFAKAKHEFPPRALTDPEGKPLLSWRVAILPYLGEEELYKRFRLDEPWDSPHNRALVEQIPSVYANPNLGAGGATNYLAIVAPGTVFESPRGLRLQDLRDGLSNTLLVVEANADRAVVWTRPEDYKADLKQPLNGLGGLRPGGFSALMADGGAHFVVNTIDPRLLRALFTYAGGEQLNNRPR